MGYVSFFQNFVQIFVLMVAWVIVLVAFFILAVQIFITLIEFKLTTLAGFVLIPFALFNKTSFLAEKVLGNIVASGIKILVLAVIVGIGSGLFSQFTSGFSDQPTITEALSLVLGALSLMGLSIFGPGIATGLVSGAPQLGAGAAVGTGLAAAGLGAAGFMGATAGLSGGGERDRSWRADDCGRCPRRRASRRQHIDGLRPGSRDIRPKRSWGCRGWPWRRGQSRRIRSGPAGPSGHVACGRGDAIEPCRGPRRRLDGDGRSVTRRRHAASSERRVLRGIAIVGCRAAGLGRSHEAQPSHAPRRHHRRPCRSLRRSWRRLRLRFS